MAGRPKRRAMIAELERRAAEDEYESALDYACEYLASGHTVTDLAADLSRTLAIEVPREMLSKYLNHAAPDAEARVAGARTRSARGLVEEAKRLIDEAEPTRDELTKAKMQADVRQWIAERFDRAEFGQPKAGSVSISVNVLHLDALRSRQATANLIGSRMGSEGESTAIAQIIAPDESPVPDSPLPDVELLSD